MEKTINIDGKDIRFRTTARVSMRYKEYLGREMMPDLMNMVPMIMKLQPLENIDNVEDLPLNAFDGVSFDTIYRLAWVYAKTADDSTPDIGTWLDGFTEFPVIDVAAELMPLIKSSISISKKMNLSNLPET